VPDRVDDASIQNADVLWRRILPDWTVTDEDGSHRVSSAAFRDNVDGNVSVHLAHLTTAESVLEGRPADGIAAISAGVPRSLGYLLVRDPTEEDPSHCLICPPPEGVTGKGRVRDAKQMAQQAQWVMLPPGF
jgi:hypothetical protein